MPGIKNFKGANDSGSSCGVLIELARVLNNQNLNYGIKFIFFDGEEGIRNYIQEMDFMEVDITLIKLNNRDSIKNVNI